MNNVIFVTGNQKKADYLSDLLEYPVDHIAIDLPEIQSTDLRAIVEHKLAGAYAETGAGVLVEDVSLEFAGLGGLPGPFIRWFLDTMSNEDICDLLAGKDRSATARCVMGYHDGESSHYFEGSMTGQVPEVPPTGDVFGWDSLFIPDGYDVTRGELDEAGDRATYMEIKPIAQLKAFLESNQ